MSETKRIDPAAIEGKEPIAVGYKIFDWRWAGYGDYCYADEDGFGIREGSGVRNSMHCLKCEGISRCIFCVGLEGAMLMLFNTPVAASRFDEVWQTLAAWHPDFTTAQELKTKYGDGEWAQTTALAKIAVISEEG